MGDINKMRSASARGREAKTVGVDNGSESAPQVHDLVVVGGQIGRRGLLERTSLRLDIGGRGPELGDDHSRVERDEDDDGDGTHGSIQDREEILVLHQLVSPSAGHLDETVDATGLDSEVSDGEGDEETLEVTAAAENDGPLVEGSTVVGPDIADDPPSILKREDAEDEKGENLEAETGHHHIVSGIERRLVAILSTGSDATANALEDKRENVAGDEDIGVPGRWDAGQRAGVGLDKILQAKVDASGQEGGGDGEQDELDLEAFGAEGIVVKDQTSATSDGLTEVAQNHGTHEGPLSVADAEEGMGDHHHTEDGSEEDVLAQAGEISIDGERYIASILGALPDGSHVERGTGGDEEMKGEDRG